MKRLSIFSVFMVLFVSASLFSDMAKATFFEDIRNAMASVSVKDVLTKKNLSMVPAGVVAFIGAHSGYNCVDMVLNVYQGSPEFVKNFGQSLTEFTGLSKLHLEKFPLDPRYVGGLIGAGFFGSSLYNYLTKEKEKNTIHVSTDKGSPLTSLFGNGLASAVSTILNARVGQCLAIFMAGLLSYQYKSLQTLPAAGTGV